MPSEGPARSPRGAWYTSLFTWLIVAIIAGIVLGALWPDAGSALKPLADGFIKLIKMLIAPIIFCTVVLGIAHVGDLKSVGRIGVKALIYFEVVTTFALIFGLAVGNIVKPGSGFSIDRKPWPPAPTPSRSQPATASCRTPSSSSRTSFPRR